MNTPLNALRHHVTGAIERGEATAIVEIPANDPDCFDLNDWVLLNFPTEYDVSKYLSPSAQYQFHLAVWKHNGSPVIA